jgi:hypothetical protein
VKKENAGLDTMKAGLDTAEAEAPSGHFLPARLLVGGGEL